MIAGTTAFHSDLRAAHNDEISHSPVGMLPVRDQSISDFMSRPINVFNGNWTTAQVANTSLTFAGVGPLINTYPIWTNKIQGFENIRGTFVLRCTINANPFQQGRLILSFVPCESMYTVSGARNFSLSQTTNLPNVEIDCRDGVGVLKVPYLTPSEFYNVKTGNYDWGTFHLNVFQPLLTGASGETTVQVSLYAYFEDFELATPLVPQMAGPTAKTRTKSRVVSMVSKEFEAQRSVKSGLITGVSSLLTDVADLTAAAVPSLAWVAEPVAWAASSVNHIASWFGWSKPILQATPTFSYRQKIPHSANANGASGAVPMGLISNNAVETLTDVTPEPFDEMSFDYIKRRFAYFQNISWSSSTSGGSSLLTANLPLSFFGETFTSTHNTHTATFAQYIPAVYLAQAFQYFRGSIRLKIKFVKTEFHTGRLQITYTPSENPTTDPTLATAAFSIREVIDIKGKSEVELTLPYLLSTPWQQTQSTVGLGRLNILVVNELRQPETAASSINMLIYAAAGDDFEVAFPFTDPTILNTPLPMFPQMDTGHSAPTGTAEQLSTVQEVIGSYAKPVKSLYYNTAMQGEVFTSIRQLIARYNFIRFLSPNFATAAGNTFYYNPWISQYETIDPSSGLLTLPRVGYDALAFVSNGFTFYRGSMRVAYFPPTQSNPTITSIRSGQNIMGAANSVGAASFAAPTIGYNTVAPYQLHDAGIGLVETAIPYYSQWPISFLDVTNTNSTVRPTDPHVQGVFESFGTNSVFNTPTFRAIGDDFQLSYFVGFLPLQTNYT
jgi:hypothetical protein